MTPPPATARIAFQGERGAFSEEAALRLLGGKISLVPRPTFVALFSAVAEGVADYILAPIENTLAGSVVPSLDLLLESRLHAVAEVVLPIALHLIAAPGAAFDQIATVESHPVALAQCERFLRAHPAWTRTATLDTAGSVLEVVRSGASSRAAVAGQHAAHIHGGVILQRHIEDHPENYTRFLLLSPEPRVSDRADKLSLVVELAHVPGALHAALGVFARRSIQLHKIESRPIPGRPWQYRFYLDLQASTNNPDTLAALEELRQCTDTIHVIGCYPAHASQPSRTPSP